MCCAACSPEYTGVGDSVGVEWTVSTMANWISVFQESEAYTYTHTYVCIHPCSGLSLPCKTFKKFLCAHSVFPCSPTEVLLFFD